jgi:hypothetical protein
MSLRAKLASAGALQVLAASIVALNASAASAATCGGTQGQPLLLGCDSNVATNETVLTTMGSTGLGVESNQNVAVALFGGVQSFGQAGVEGRGGQYGVWGIGDTGVFGQSNLAGGTAVQGLTYSGVGLDGESSGPTGTGVQGSTSGNGTAVYGDNTGATGTGVFGDATTGTGVLAHSTNGTALAVNGPAHFSQSGIAIVPSGAKSATVTMAGVTTSNMILATVQQAGGFYVKYAVPAAGSFTIAINKAPAAPQTVKVAFLVLS